MRAQNSTEPAGSWDFRSQPGTQKKETTGDSLFSMTAKALKDRNGNKVCLSCLLSPGETGGWN